jgi:hypothetical protein
MVSTSKTVKFKISLKELSVEFEGDIQSAERMHGEIAGAINSLAAVQAKALPPGPKVATVPTPVVESGSRRRGSRRRRPVSGNGIDPSIIEGTVVDPAAASGPAEPTMRAPRRSSGSQSELLTQLKGEGFFGEKRTNGDIRARLATKGHTFQSNEINPSLVRLTQQGVLQREKDAAKDQWVYFAP